MRPAKPPNDKCPQGADRQSCPLTCKYNHFESDDLTIDAWELKCLDCGWRETIGFRSDEMDDEDESVDPTACPFCKTCELSPGKDPCQKKNADDLD
jgi:hypothetical protein